MAACLFYVFVYTLWLKRTSKSNIVIGGAAGAAPVLIGWSAVTNSLAWAPWLLFAVIFFWTPPHFWALAIRYKDDYAAADVPMLPVVATLRATLDPDPRLHGRASGPSPWCSPRSPTWAPSTGSSAIVLGAVFTAFAVRLLQDPTPKRAMRLFSCSITYVTLLFGAMALDVLVRFGL